MFPARSPRRVAHAEATRHTRNPERFPGRPGDSDNGSDNARPKCALPPPTEIADRRSARPRIRQLKVAPLPQESGQDRGILSPASAGAVGRADPDPDLASLLAEAAFRDGNRAWPMLSPGIPLESSARRRVNAFPTRSVNVVPSAASPTCTRTRNLAVNPPVADSL